MRLLSPADIRTLLARHGVRPSRALGQNFLADANTARRIVRLAGVGPGSRVLEIGPGVGSLTLALAEAVSGGQAGTAEVCEGRAPGSGAASGEVLALELDRHLLPVLEEVLAGAPAVRVVQGDALHVDYGALLAGAAAGPETGAGPGTGAAVGAAAAVGAVAPGPPWTMVSNLPYNVATPLMAHLLEDVPQIERLVVMVQKEVAERLAAPPGRPAAGAISVKVAYHADASMLAVVPPTVFVPRPRVDSAVVAFDRRPAPPVDVPSARKMFELARAGFGQRRKTLRQSLRPILGAAAEEVLRAAGLDPSARAETLRLEDWAALTRAAAVAGAA